MVPRAKRHGDGHGQTKCLSLAAVRLPAGSTPLFFFPSFIAYHRSDMLSLYSQFPGFNMHFRVKLSTSQDTRGRLIGLRGFVAAVGDIDLATRIYTAAFNSRGDKFQRRLRRGICFTFYAR